MKTLLMVLMILVGSNEVEVNEGAIDKVYWNNGTYYIEADMNGQMISQELFQDEFNPYLLKNLESILESKKVRIEK